LWHYFSLSLLGSFAILRPSVDTTRKYTYAYYVDMYSLTFVTHHWEHRMLPIQFVSTHSNVGCSQFNSLAPTPTGTCILMWKLKLVISDHSSLLIYEFNAIDFTQNILSSYSINFQKLNFDFHLAPKIF
jgi:hypothetical protein